MTQEVRLGNPLHPADHQIRFTIFADVNGATKNEHASTYAALREVVAAAREYPTKAHMPLVKMATFGSVVSKRKSLRHNENMVHIFGVEGDYDGGVVSVHEAAERLRAAGVRGLIYTTPRHSPSAPRWRVLCALSGPHLPAQRREFVGVLNAILGGVLATESYTTSQAFYVGRVAGAPYEVVEVDGDHWLDELALFHAPLFPSDDDAIEGEDIDPLMFANVTDDTMADIRSAVMALKPHRYGPGSYQQWLRVILALNSLRHAGREAEARSIALEFSRRGGAAFDQGVFDRKWRELPRKTTFRSIFVMAQEDGWVNPKSARPEPERPDGGRVDMTDSGNKNALFEATGGNLRHITERKAWMWWDGQGWPIDDAGALARNAALRVAERYLKLAVEKEAEADRLPPDDRKRALKLAESLRAWAHHCRNKRGLDAMLAEAQRDDRFAVRVALLDKDPLVLGVANGVVDLRTGTLRPSGRDDFVTKRSPFKFEPGARAPRWEQFINEVTGEPLPGGRIKLRPKLAAYAHRAIGYWSTGLTREHKMNTATGAGANGKSVLFDVLASVLGDYVVRIPPETMMANSRDVDGERPTPFARNLAGARLAFGSEAREGQKLNASWIKRTTGDATMTARGLHENAFTFPITHKLVLLTNYEPHLDHMDDATRGRVHVWPFDVRWNRPGLPERNPDWPDGDKELMPKLLAEGEGILAWIVAGAVAYLRDGLDPPGEVATRTLQYFDKQDGFSQWLRTMERCAARDGEQSMHLLSQFHGWCATEGYPATPSTARAFADALSHAGIERDRVTAGTVWGLRHPGARDLF